MEPDERFEDTHNALDERIERHLDRVWTSMPVIVKPGSYNGTKQTVTLYMGVQGEEKTFMPDGTPLYTPTKMPELPDVPIHYPAWGGFTITGPVSDNDEGIVHFATRCLDGWFQNGGQQARMLRVRHDIGDGMFVPGLKSQPNALNPPPSTDSVQVRSNDGTFYWDLNKTTGAKLVVGGVTVMTVDQNGNAIFKGNVTEGGFGGANITLGAHTHAQGPDSDGDTEQETAPPTPGH